MYITSTYLYQSVSNKDPMDQSVSHIHSFNIAHSKIKQASIQSVNFNSLEIILRGLNNFFNKILGGIYGTTTASKFFNWRKFY